MNTTYEYTKRVSEGQINDIITNANVTSNAFRDESQNYQMRFISGYKVLVVGKNIDKHHQYLKKLNIIQNL